MAGPWDSPPTQDEVWATPPTEEERGGTPPSLVGSTLRTLGKSMVPGATTLEAAGEALGAGLGVPLSKERAPGNTFIERFRNAKKFYEDQSSRDKSAYPNMAAVAGPVGATAGTLGLMGLAGPASALMAPMSALAKTGPLAARMAAGATDALLWQGGLNALDKPEHPIDSWVAAADIGNNIPTAIGGAALPMVAAAAGATPMAGQWWKEYAAKHRARAIAPGSPTAQASMREHLGSQVEAGLATKDIGGKDLIRDIESPQGRADYLSSASASGKERVGSLVEEASNRGARVDAGDVLARAEQAAAKRFGPRDPTPLAGGKGAVTETIGGSLAQKRQEAYDLIDRMKQHYREKFRPTSTNVDYPAPPQGELGLPPGNLTAGPEATMPELKWDAYATRPSGPAPAQGLGLQREMSLGNKYPPPLPPSATSTNTSVKGLPLSDWEQLKSGFQGLVHEVRGRYPLGTPQATIKADPSLSFLNELSGIVKGADEAAFREAHPNKFPDFMRAKRQVQIAETLNPPAQEYADAAAAGQAGGTHFYPSKHGAMYWLLRSAAEKARNKAAIPASESMSRMTTAEIPQSYLQTLSALLRESE